MGAHLRLPSLDKEGREPAGPLDPGRSQLSKLVRKLHPVFQHDTLHEEQGRRSSEGLQSMKRSSLTKALRLHFVFLSRRRRHQKGGCLNTSKVSKYVQSCALVRIRHSSTTKRRNLTKALQRPEGCDNKNSVGRAKPLRSRPSSVRVDLMLLLIYHEQNGQRGQVTVPHCCLSWMTLAWCSCYEKNLERSLAVRLSLAETASCYSCM